MKLSQTEAENNSLLTEAQMKTQKILQVHFDLLKKVNLIWNQLKVNLIQ
jgi:hypothetical protein